MTEQYKNDQPKLIEMPEHLRIEAGIKEAAKPIVERLGRYGGPVVPIDTADVTPEMVRKAGDQISPDTYVLPEISSTNRE